MTYYWPTRSDAPKPRLRVVAVGVPRRRHFGLNGVPSRRRTGARRRPNLKVALIGLLVLTMLLPVLDATVYGTQAVAGWLWSNFPR